MPRYDSLPAPQLTGPLGFFGAAPVSQPSGYSTGYATANRAMSGYTPNSQSGAYTGGLLDLLQAARLTDLNTLRVAVENLRSVAESCTQQHNSLVADLKTLGLIA